MLTALRGTPYSRFIEADDAVFLMGTVAASLGVSAVTGQDGAFRPPVRTERRVHRDDIRPEPRGASLELHDVDRTLTTFMTQLYELISLTWSEAFSQMRTILSAQFSPEREAADRGFTLTFCIKTKRKVI